MATYAPLVSGTASVWTSSGGNHVLIATSLGNAAARQGDKSSAGDILDATKGLAALLEVVAETKVQVAPTDGNTIDVYLGFSSSATAGSDNVGGLTGADASLASPVSVTPQMVFCGSIIMSNAIGTGIQRQRFLIQPQDAYMIPVIVNSSGQTLSATGTDTKITITPWYAQSS
jgi:hypothetical protein